MKKKKPEPIAIGSKGWLANLLQRLSKERRVELYQYATGFVGVTYTISLDDLDVLDDKKKRGTK